MNIHSVMARAADTKPTRGAHGRHAGRRAAAARSGDKGEAILAAALELFVERGFFGTAVPEIAERAEVGAGTIYRYFESKEALVNALYRAEKQRFAQVVLEDFPLVGTAREQFRTMWMRMAAFATKHPQAFVFLELHHHARYLDAESRALEDRLLALFTSVVTAAQARGELKAGPPGLLMGIVLGAFVGVTRSCVELGRDLASADWKLADQCVWEALRA
jgi:AcrR family transcriptional regulator